MVIDSKRVGIFEDQELVEYTIRNNNGIEVSVLNLGGIITKIMVPDKDGNFENIVLAYEDYSKYFTNNSYYGAVIGRFAGRIYRGQLDLDDEHYEFQLNNGLNHLHGGSEFNKAIWNVSTFDEEHKVGLVLEYTSPDGREGYPGEVKVKVTYVLNDQNEFEFLINGTTNKTTVLNVTNHTYFNLSGNYKRDVLKQNLSMSADKFSEIEEGVTGTGALLPVKNTPFDFYDGKEIGKDINDDSEQLGFGGGYDHPFVFDSEIGEITLRDQESGRVMHVSTNNPVVVVYTMNFPNEGTLYNGVEPTKNLGICLETQNPAIGKNQWGKEYSILKPCDEYSRYTKYKFEIIK